MSIRWNNGLRVRTYGLCYGQMGFLVEAFGLRVLCGTIFYSSSGFFVFKFLYGFRSSYDKTCVVDLLCCFLATFQICRRGYVQVHYTNFFCVFYASRSVSQASTFVGYGDFLQGLFHRVVSRIQVQGGWGLVLLRLFASFGY